MQYNNNNTNKDNILWQKQQLAKKKNKINNANIDSIQNVVRVFTRLNNSAIVGRRTVHQSEYQESG